MLADAPIMLADAAISDLIVPSIDLIDGITVDETRLIASEGALMGAETPISAHDEPLEAD